MSKLNHRSLHITKMPLEMRYRPLLRRCGNRLSACRARNSLLPRSSKRVSRVRLCRAKSSANRKKAPLSAVSIQRGKCGIQWRLLLALRGHHAHRPTMRFMMRYRPRTGTLTSTTSSSSLHRRRHPHRRRVSSGTGRPRKSSTFCIEQRTPLHLLPPRPACALSFSSPVTP